MSRKQRKLPATYFGFPVADDENEELRKTNGRKNRKRGVALVIAIFAISIVMVFATDLILSSQVTLRLSTAQRDNLKAEFMAKSALNLSLFLITADLGLDLFMAQADPTAKMKDSIKKDIWTYMNGIPIGGETLEMLTSMQEGFELHEFLDSGVMDQMKLFDGEFITNISDEASKINVNYCAIGRCTETLMMLEALFSCPVEKQFLENKKIDPKELAYKIKDWVDGDSKAEPASGSNDEDDPYSNLTPRYGPKNAPLDSLDELKMIDGWDNEVHAVFAPYLSLFPLQAKGTDKAQININTVSRELLMCLFPEVRGDCSEKFTLAMHARDTEGIEIGSGVVGQTLRDVMCYTGDGEDGSTGNREKWFKQASMVFRIEASGRVGDQEKQLIAIVQRRMPDIKKGEKSAYKILYWKMI